MLSPAINHAPPLANNWRTSRERRNGPNLAKTGEILLFSSSSSQSSTGAISYRLVGTVDQWSGGTTVCLIHRTARDIKQCINVEMMLQNTTLNTTNHKRNTWYPEQRVVLYWHPCTARSLSLHLKKATRGKQLIHNNQSNLASYHMTQYPGKALNKPRLEYIQINTRKVRSGYGSIQRTNYFQNGYSATAMLMHWKSSLHTTWYWNELVFYSHLNKLMLWLQHHSFN